MKRFSEFSSLNESEELLSEAKFSIEKMDRAITLLASIASKYASGKFREVTFKPWGLQDFKKSDGTVGTGKLYMNNSGEKLRIGYAKAKGMKSKRMEINSVDYWSQNNFDLGRPTRSVVAYPDNNIVDIARDLLKYAVTGNQDPIEKLAESMLMSEAKNKRLITYALGKGVDETDTAALSDSKLITHMKKMGVWDVDEYRGYKSVSNEEKNSAEVSIKVANKDLKGRPYSDPEYVFDDILSLTKIVASGFQNSLIIAGMAGVGKTYGVEKTLGSELGPEGKKWKHFKGGKVSPFGVYSTLFQYRDDKVIVFDDSDSVWKNEDSVNMLKSALDTYDVRKISWNSPSTKPVGGWDDDQKDAHNQEIDQIFNGQREGVVGKDIQLPSEFQFTSRVIFISNLPPNKIDSAIRSRSLFMDINLKREDVINRIKNILDVNPKYADIPQQERYDIVDSLSEGSGEITMRSIEAAIACRSALGKGSDWKRLAAQYASGS